MKHILVALVLLAGISGFAGKPETGRILKTTYNIEPEPPTTSPNGYLYDCCRSVVLGWDLTHTCYDILVECWGACSGHGWLVTTCTTGTTIRGAFLLPEETGPKSVKLPLVTGVLADKFDTSLDPASQVVEYKKIRNSLIRLETTITIETEEDVFVFAPGTYQIINSELMLLVSKTQF